MPFPNYPILAFLVSACLHARGASGQTSKGQKTEPNERPWVFGEASQCVRRRAVLGREGIYYIEAIADKPDLLFIRADKIVEGKAITMGSGAWQYNWANHTLFMESEQRLWLLNINGRRIEGRLRKTNDAWQHCSGG